MTMDVLHHHNGVVDHEADRDGERHEGDVVEAEIEQIHRRELAEQRQRHGNAGDESRPEIAQEQENDQHHESDGQPQGELDVVHGGANGRGAVENGLDLDGGRYPGGKLRKLRLDLVDSIDNVGAGLLEHSQYDAGLIVLIAGYGPIHRLRNRLADVTYSYRRAPAVGQDNVIECLGLENLVIGGDREADF